MAIVATKHDIELVRAIEELSIYLNEDEVVTAFNVGNSFFTAAEAWRFLDPETPEEIALYYQTTPSLVHQLVFANYGIPHELELIRKTQVFFEGAGSVLDLGGGIGSFLLGLGVKERVHADFSGFVFEYAKWRYSRESNSELVRMVELPALYFKQASMLEVLGQFDGVICTEVIEHAPDPKAVVAFLSELVKPGGKLVATVSFDDVDGTVPQHLNVGKWSDEEFITNVFPEFGFKRIDEHVFEKVAK